jgi:phosphate transport system substrate-binding protein
MSRRPAQYSDVARIAPAARRTRRNGMLRIFTVFSHVLCLPTLFGLAACASAGSPKGGVSLAAAEQPRTEAGVTPDLRLVGSSTLGAQLTPRLAAAFLTRLGAAAPPRVEEDRGRAHTKISAQVNGRPVTLVVDYPGTGAGFEALGWQTCDIALASRPIASSEAERFTGTDGIASGARQHVVAMDGIAVVVHPSNPVDVLTVTQVARIFGGESRSWADVGGRKRTGNGGSKGV